MTLGIPAQRIKQLWDRHPFASAVLATAGFVGADLGALAVLRHQPDHFDAGAAAAAKTPAPTKVNFQGRSGTMTVQGDTVRIVLDPSR